MKLPFNNIWLSLASTRVLGAKLKNIWQDKSGNFGILSALLMVPLIGAAGVALDVTRGMAVKSDLQMAADAAALAVVADTSTSVKTAKEMSGDGVIAVGSDEASAFFESNQPANPD